MTVFSSGISMYVMARLIQTLHLFDAPIAAVGLPASWVFHASIVISAGIVLIYIFLGGLTSAIYNEVIQFFLIVAGFRRSCGSACAAPAVCRTSRRDYQNPICMRGRAWVHPRTT